MPQSITQPQKITMKAIETTATLTENGQLTLDEPLALAHHSRVRVIVLVDEEAEEELEDTSIAEIREGLARGWADVLAGRIHPVSELWESMDVE